MEARSIYRRWGVLVATIQLCGAIPAAARTWVVTDLSRVAWDRLAPGDEVQLDRNTGTGIVIVTARGAEDKPIVIRAAPGRSPVLNNSIVFDNAAYVVVEGLTVENAPQAAFLLKSHSHHITVRNSVARQSQLGIWIGEDAGRGNRITSNEVYGNATHGIAIDLADATPAEPTVIAANEVYRNGIHGVEVSGSYYVIEQNRVWENGQKLSGSSGIHLYAANSSQHTCSHDVIRYNRTFHNLEPANQDGNGIQIDQWCNDNRVYYNLSFENDGAGIMLFDASRNQVTNNTSYGNMRDPSRSHAYRAELVLASDDVHAVNSTVANIVENNILVSTRPGTVAAYVSSSAAGRGQIIGANLLFNATGGDAYFWSGSSGRDVNTWNRLKNGPDDDVSADPRFVDVTEAVHDGLRATAAKQVFGRGLDVGLQADLTGAPVPAGKPDLGAYQHPAR